MATYTQLTLAQTAELIRVDVLNRNAPYKADRLPLPGYDYFMSKRQQPSFAQGQYQIKYQVQGGLQEQAWGGLQELSFGRADNILTTTLGWYNAHMGLELVHEDIENATGAIVVPNRVGRGKDIATGSAPTDLPLVKYIATQIESLYNDRKVDLDKRLWLSNASNALQFPGFDTFFPRATSANMVTDAGGTRGRYTTGSIGSLARATHPTLLAHYLWLNATYSAGGTLDRALDTALYQAQLYSRDRTTVGKPRIFAGRRAMEKRLQYLRNNGLVVFGQLEKDGKFDAGYRAGNQSFGGIPIEVIPTFALLDTIDSQTYAWDDCFIVILDNAVNAGFAAGKEELFSVPIDPANTRLTRMSLDDKTTGIIPSTPNGVAIVHVAA